ncbi:MAG: ribonuclease P protein component [Proteobacteria bacterium]|nr:ribonuclease P protein component [Pseudomonadota bacterium]
MSSFEGRFQACNRLKRPEEYKRVFSSKHRSSDKSFLFLAINNGISLARLGLAVPKKYIHSAVDRNRLKRIIRESFRSRQKQLEGKDIVVVVKNRLDVNREKIELMLIKHWDRIIK